jgi:hypothetical protein
MQDSRRIVSAPRQNVTQRIFGEPVFIPGMAIWKPVNATPYHHELKVHRSEWYSCREIPFLEERLTWPEGDFLTPIRASRTST